jgi:hypothetical protein
MAVTSCRFMRRILEDGDIIFLSNLNICGVVISVISALWGLPRRIACGFSGDPCVKGDPLCKNWKFGNPWGDPPFLSSLQWLVTR